MNCTTMGIAGSVTITGITAGAAGTNGTALIGAFYSMLRSQLWRHDNGTILENIDDVGVLYNNITNQTTNAAEAISLSCLVGSGSGGAPSSSFSINSGFGNFGVVFDASNQTFSFFLPLLGVMNNDKPLPLHFGGFELSLNFSPMSEWTRDLTAIAGSVATGYTINSLELVGELLVLEQEGMNNIMKMYPTIRIKSESYVSKSDTIAASSGAGTYEFQLGFTLKGAKRLIWSVSVPTACDKKFSGINPNLQSYQLIVGNRTFPQQPVDASKLSVCFAENQKSYGSLYSSQHTGSCTRKTFGVASTAYMGATGEWKAFQDASNVAYATLISNVSGNKFTQHLDLETLPQGSQLFNGISTVGGSTILRFITSAALAAQTHNLHIHMNYDVLLELDWQNGLVNVIQ